MSLKDLMSDWVNENTWELDDGTFRAADADENLLTEQVFATEDAVCDWLWNYIAANSDILMPCP